jgi:hypothetical protein
MPCSTVKLFPILTWVGGAETVEERARGEWEGREGVSEEEMGGSKGAEGEEEEGQGRFSQGATRQWGGPLECPAGRTTRRR